MLSLAAESSAPMRLSQTLYPAQQSLLATLLTAVVLLLALVCVIGLAGHPPPRRRLLLAVFGGLSFLWAVLGLTWRHPAFLPLSAAGILALAAAFPGPEVGGRTKAYLPLLLAMGGMCLSVLLQILADRREGWLEEQLERMKHEDPDEQYLYLPDPKSARVMAAGGDNLAADLYWLQSLGYAAAYFKRGQKGQLMARFYRLVTDLDPHWRRPYTFGALLISALIPQTAAKDAAWEALRRAERLLLEGRSRHPDDPGMLRGLCNLWIVQPDDPADVPEYMKRVYRYATLALQLRGLSPADRDFFELVQKNALQDLGWDRLLAAASLERAHYQALPEEARQQEARVYLLAESRERVRWTQGMVREFHRQVGRWPQDLAEVARFLEQTGKLKKPPGNVPLEATGVPLRYDPLTGQVSSLAVQAQASVQKADVVRRFIADFHGEYQEHVRRNPTQKNLLRPYPKDLGHLRRAVLQRFAGWSAKDQGEPPPEVLAKIRRHLDQIEYQALGEKLDFATNPLGGEFTYHPDTGVLESDPRAVPEVFYRHHEAIARGWTPPFWADGPVPPPPQFRRGAD